MSEAAEETEGLVQQDSTKSPDTKDSKHKYYRAVQEALIWVELAVDDDENFQAALDSIPETVRGIQDSIKLAMPKYVHIKWRGKLKVLEVK